MVTAGESEPNKRMKPTALRAAAYPRRWAAIKSARSDIRLDEVMGSRRGGEDDGRTGS